MSKRVNISEFVGKTFVKVAHDPDRGLEFGEHILFVTDNGEKYVMYHERDCCEAVYIEDICGDLANLVGSPILFAEESTSDTKLDPNEDSCTWTFYKIATAKGWVDIRWYGSSNGYYSEAVDIIKVDDEE